jgi:hypothetical protein
MRPGRRRPPRRYREAVAGSTPSSGDADWPVRNIGTGSGAKQVYPRPVGCVDRLVGAAERLRRALKSGAPGVSGGPG